MAYATPPPPAKGRRSTTKIVLMVVGAILTLCCIGGVAGGFALYTNVKKATDPAKETVAAFLDDVAAANYSAAYGRLCQDTRNAYTEDRFANVVAGRPRPTRHELTNVNVSNVNGRVTATVVAELTYAGGDSGEHTFSLVKEGDAWKVCGNPY